MTCQHIKAILKEDELKIIEVLRIIEVLMYRHVKVHKVGLGVALPIPEMPKYVDLSPYWTDDKQLSIQKAKDKTGLDKRTLSAAKKGQLDRGQFETLYKLRDLASELAGKPLALEEIFSDH